MQFLLISFLPRIIFDLICLLWLLYHRFSYSCLQFCLLLLCRYDTVLRRGDVADVKSSLSRFNECWSQGLAVCQNLSFPTIGFQNRSLSEKSMKSSEAFVPQKLQTNQVVQCKRKMDVRSVLSVALMSRHARQLEASSVQTFSLWATTRFVRLQRCRKTVRRQYILLL